MEAEPEAEAEPEPETVSGGPYFLFVPAVLHGRFYQTQAAVLGSLFALELAVAVLATIMLCRHLSRDAKLVLIAVIAVAGLRAAFFIIDPWHVPEHLPALSVALIFGVPFPLRNLMTALLFFSLRQLVLNVNSGRSQRVLSRSGSAPSDSVATRIRTGVLLTCLVEMCVQVFTDTMRALGHSFPILRACKAFFVAWGLATALGFSCWTVRLHRLSRSALKGIAATARSGQSEPSYATTRQAYLRRLFGCFWTCAAVGLITACSSIAYLALPAVNSDRDALGVLYTLDHAAELLQCAATLALVMPKAAHRRNTLVRAATLTKSHAKMALSCTSEPLPIAQLSSPMESARRSDDLGEASPGPGERWQAHSQCAAVAVKERALPTFAVTVSAAQHGSFQNAESSRATPIATIVVEDHERSRDDHPLADATSLARVTELQIGPPGGERV